MLSFVFFSNSSFTSSPSLFLLSFNSLSFISSLFIFSLISLYNSFISFLLSVILSLSSISLFSFVSSFSSWNDFPTLNLLFSWDSSSKDCFGFSFPMIFNSFSDVIKIFLNLYWILFIFLITFLVVILISFGDKLALSSFFSMISSPILFFSILNSSFLTTKEFISFDIPLIYISSLWIFSSNALLSFLFEYILSILNWIQLSIFVDNCIFLIFSRFCCCKLSKRASLFKILISFLSLILSCFGSFSSLIFSFCNSSFSLFWTSSFSIVNLIFSCGVESLIELSFSFPLIFIWLFDVIKLFLNWFNFMDFLNIFFVVILISLLNGDLFWPSNFIALFILTIKISSFDFLLMFISSILSISNIGFLSYELIISIWLTFSGIFNCFSLSTIFSDFNIVNLILSCSTGFNFNFSNSFWIGVIDFLFKSILSSGIFSIFICIHLSIFNEALSIFLFSLLSFNIFSTVNLLLSWGSFSKIGFSFIFSVPIILKLFSDTIELFLNLWWWIIFFLYTFFVVIFISFSLGSSLEISSFLILLIFISSFLLISNSNLLLCLLDIIDKDISFLLILFSSFKDLSFKLEPLDISNLLLFCSSGIKLTNCLWILLFNWSLSNNVFDFSSFWLSSLPFDDKIFWFWFSDTSSIWIWIQ